MAGHRRGTGRPELARIRRDTRQQRRRERMAERMAQATTPSERVGVAAEHLRAVLPQVPAERAEQIGSVVVRALTDAVEQAYREEERA